MWHEREALPSAQTGHIDNPPWGDLTGTGSPPPGPLGQIALLGDGVASAAPAWRVNRHTCLKFSITGRQTSPPPRSPIISHSPCCMLVYLCTQTQMVPFGNWLSAVVRDGEVEGVGVNRSQPWPPGDCCWAPSPETLSWPGHPGWLEHQGHDPASLGLQAWDGDVVGLPEGRHGAPAQQ